MVSVVFINARRHGHFSRIPEEKSGLMLARPKMAIVGIFQVVVVGFFVLFSVLNGYCSVSVR